MQLSPQTCPKCNSADVYQIESTELRRPVLGANEYGVVKIEGRYEVLDEDSENESLYCGDCLHRWALPEAVDYV